MSEMLNKLLTDDDLARIDEVRDWFVNKIPDKHRDLHSSTGCMLRLIQSQALLLEAKERELEREIGAAFAKGLVRGKHGPSDKLTPFEFGEQYAKQRIRALQSTPSTPDKG